MHASLHVDDLLMRQFQLFAHLVIRRSFDLTRVICAGSVNTGTAWCRRDSCFKTLHRKLVFSCFLNQMSILIPPIPETSIAESLSGQAEVVWVSELSHRI